MADGAFAVGDVAGSADRYAAIEYVLTGLGMLDVDLSPGPERVEAVLRLGDRSGAAGLAEAYARRAVKKASPWAMARAARAGALAGPEERAESGFLAGLDLHRATVDVFELARTQLRTGAGCADITDGPTLASPSSTRSRNSGGWAPGPGRIRRPANLRQPGSPWPVPATTPLTQLTPREL